MSPTTHLLFLTFVAAATFCQNLTGFAFALILLGFVGSFDLIPITDAANVSSVLVMFNAWRYCYHHKLKPEWSLLRLIVPGSLVGVLVGVAMLTWFSGNAHHILQLLLGIVIVGCAVLLLSQGASRKDMSGAPTTFLFGLISGVLGGLFSTSGPPMVYHLYRQPLDRTVIRQCLLLMFACNAVLRLGLVIPTGHFSRDALWFSLEAVPMVTLVTWLQAKFLPPMSGTAVKLFVCALLVVSGLSLIVTGIKSI